MTRLLLALLLCLSGCSSFEFKNECQAAPAAPDRCGATTPQMVPHTPAFGRNVVLIGDSITWRWGNYTYWPVETVNLGVSGSKVCDYVYFTPKPWYIGETIVLMYGVNDIKDGATADETWTCFLAFIEIVKLQWPRANLVILGTLPVGLSIDYYNAALTALRAYEAASGYTYIDPMPLLSCVEGGRVVFCDAYTDDAVHPNNAGYAAMAAWLALP
jgi:lysophospholipase L1-like esterase